MVIPRLLPGWGRYAGSPVSPLQRSTIVSAYQLDIGVAATGRVLRGAGMGLRAGAIREIRREIGGTPERLRAYKSLRGDFRPAESMFTPTRTNLRTERKYWGKMTARIPGIAEDLTVNVSFGSDEALTKNQIEDTMVEIAEGYQMAYGATIESIEVTGLDRRSV